jgi:hypothetical protein
VRWSPSSAEFQGLSLAGQDLPEESISASANIGKHSERITRCAEVGAIPTTASGSNGRLGIGTKQGMPVVAGEVLVRFERVEDNWTKRRPASKG